MSMLKDLSSRDRNGLENIQLAFDKNLPSRLVNVTSESERQNAIDAMYKQLTARLNDQTAREICEAFSYALSWNTTVTANPTPLPIHSSLILPQSKQIRYIRKRFNSSNIKIHLKFRSRSKKVKLLK